MKDEILEVRSQKKRMIQKKVPDTDTFMRSLFDRVVSILEQARGHVVRAVNTQMVTAYWLIGREIVEEVQEGEERAVYGKQVVENLSARLTERYGKGFSVTNLWYFRQFYRAFADRVPILHPMGGESSDSPKLHLPGGESASVEKHRPADDELEFGFSPLLSWSHYRALMRVEDAAARAFYEREAAECGWSSAEQRGIASGNREGTQTDRGGTG